MLLFASHRLPLLPSTGAGVPIPAAQPAHALAGNELHKAALSDPFAALTGLPPKSSPGAGELACGVLQGMVWLTVLALLVRDLTSPAVATCWFTAGVPATPVCPAAPRPSPPRYYGGQY